MIYEVRTYQLKPGTLNEVVKVFGEHYEERKKFSELAAFWYTEIGPLNEIIHVWPYADMAERNRVRAAASASPHWPPPIREHVVAQRSELFTPSPATPQFLSGEVGPYFEMRSYGLAPGAVPSTIEAWQGGIAARKALSPVVISMFTEFGELNKHVHVWAYKSLEQRTEIRARARAEGIWPPKGAPGRLLTQENKILLAAPFSPVRIRAIRHRPSTSSARAPVPALACYGARSTCAQLVL